MGHWLLLFSMLCFTQLLGKKQAELQGFYINVACAEDRRLAMEEELVKWNLKGVSRYSAVEPVCGLSHAHVVRMAHQKRWPYVLVLEDDVQFSDSPQKVLSHVIKELGSHWDVILLGARFSSSNRQGDLLYDPQKKLGRTKRAGDAHAYIVNRRYMLTFANFVEKKWEEANLTQKHQKLTEEGTLPEKLQEISRFYVRYFRIDTDKIWGKLQKKGRWILPSPLIAIQKGGYSYNERRYIRKEEGFIADWIQAFSNIETVDLMEHVVRKKRKKKKEEKAAPLNTSYM